MCSLSPFFISMAVLKKPKEVKRQRYNKKVLNKNVQLSTFKMNHHQICNFQNYLSSRSEKNVFWNIFGSF